MNKLQKPILLEPEELLDFQHTDLLIIDVRPEKEYQQGHIPEAFVLSPGRLVVQQGKASGKLPPASDLQVLFSVLGLKDSTLVVACDDEGGGWAGRLAWTLDMVGHHRWAYLNGGLRAWRGSNLPLTTAVPEARKPNLDFKVVLQSQYRAEFSELKADFAELTIWDARAGEEYRGEKQTAAHNGHIPGAIHLEWFDLMDRQNNLKLRTDLTHLLKAQGLDASHAIVTHCHTHHRSGLTYMAGRLLGYQNIRGYDGSWSEWGNQEDAPITIGNEP